MVKRAYLALILCFGQIADNESGQHLDVDVKIFKTQSRRILRFQCMSYVPTKACAAEFVINNRTIDNLRYGNNTCYHGTGECNPEVCTCTADCRNFTLNYTESIGFETFLFGCVARFEDKVKILQRKKVFKYFNGTGDVILKRKKKAVFISDQESILLLRAYQTFPSGWEKILDDIHEKRAVLPKEAQNLFETSSKKQLKTRLLTNLGKLLATPQDKINNLILRQELQNVKGLERKLTKEKDKNDKTDRRDEFALQLSDDNDLEANTVQAPEPEQNVEGQRQTQQKEQDKHDEDGAPVQCGSKCQQRGQNQRKRKHTPIMELIRQNQMEYNKFITKKIPKLLKYLGVSSSDSED